MSEEGTFYGYDPSGFREGHDSIDEREAAVAAAQRILAGPVVPVPRRFLLALMADLQAAKRALESVLLADLDPDDADDVLHTPQQATASKRYHHGGSVDDPEVPDMAMMTAPEPTYPDWYMNVGPHNVPLVAPQLGYTYVTSRGESYRQDSDSGLIHAHSADVQGLLGLGFTHAAAGPAASER